MLSSLTFLKSQLLAEALRETTDYDAQLQSLGAGVAGQFEKHCNRKFPRTVDDTFICPADRDFVYLPRTPIEEIASVELKTSDEGDWAEQSGFIINSDFDSGYVRFANLGLDYARLRFTFTGGFWFDTSEDGSGTIPESALALPADLKLAWLLQCKKVWEVTDPLGTKIVPSKDAVQLVGLSLAGLELIPQVKQILEGYKRYALA